MASEPLWSFVASRGNRREDQTSIAVSQGNSGSCHRVSLADAGPGDGKRRSSFQSTGNYTVTHLTCVFSRVHSQASGLPVISQVRLWLPILWSPGSPKFLKVITLLFRQQTSERVMPCLLRWRGKHIKSLSPTTTIRGKERGCSC